MSNELLSGEGDELYVTGNNNINITAIANVNNDNTNNETTNMLEKIDNGMSNDLIIDNDNTKSN